MLIISVLFFFLYMFRFLFCFSLFCVKIFEILMKQEETKQAEFRSKVAEFHQMKAQQETVSLVYVFLYVKILCYQFFCFVLCC